MNLLGRWLPVFAWTGLIYYLSSRSTFPIQPKGEGWSYLAHLLEYAVLGLLLARALSRATGRSPRRLVLVALTGAALAALDELHQAFVPGRNASLLDWAVDLVGVAAVLAVLCIRRGI